MNRMVITGATSGVGEGLAKHFTEQEWLVWGLGRNGPRLRQMERDLPNFVGYATDIGNYKDVEYAFEAAGKIDVLINNAGVYMRGPLRKHLPHSIMEVINTNLLGTIFVTYCALPKLKTDARIINISSVAALHGIEEESIYCATKYGLEGFMESLSLELRDKKIQITTIYPGGINTPLWNKTNKYPGDLDDLLTVEDIVTEVDNVINLRDGVIKKKVILWPSTENH